MACCCACLLPILGWISLIYIFYRLFTALYNVLYPFYIAKPIDLRIVAGGNWAVVTGSTDGIGKGYAFELARKGFNIVLIARSAQKLENVKNELINATNVLVKTIVFDFSSTDVDEYENKIFAELKQIEVHVLVNNVGAIVPYPDLLHKALYGPKEIVDVQCTNMISMTLMCKGILPQMVERNKGIIVNISSSATYQVMKMSAVYSSTKAYCSMFTRVLQKDYNNTDIVIQLVCPMVVITNMSEIYLKHRKSVFDVPVDYFVKNAVRSIGNISETTGCPLHQIMREIGKFVPTFLLSKYLDDVITQFQKASLEAYLEKQKKAES